LYNAITTNVFLVQVSDKLMLDPNEIESIRCGYDENETVIMMRSGRHHTLTEHMDLVIQTMTESLNKLKNS